MPALVELQSGERTEAEKRTPRARVVEVFGGIQGEAELVGVRQIFLRFFGCNLRCAWCDSPETLTAPRGSLPAGRAEQTPGRADFRAIPNPASLEDVVAAVRALAVVPHHSVSLTGGEPLLHVRFLERLLPELERLGALPYLETNGLLPGHLERVVDRLSWISMDLKLPSCTGDPCPDWLERHRGFLRVARAGQPGAPRTFLKLIVGAEADEREMREAFRLTAEEASGCSLTLQPVTPFGSVTAAPSMEQMLEWHALASRYVGDVRVIPQLHKLMNVL